MFALSLKKESGGKNLVLVESNGARVALKHVVGGRNIGKPPQNSLEILIWVFCRPWRPLSDTDCCPLGYSCFKLDFCREANSNYHTIGSPVQFNEIAHICKTTIGVDLGPESFVVSLHKTITKPKTSAKQLFLFFPPLCPRETDFSSRCNWRRIDGCRGGLWLPISLLSPPVPQKCQSVGSPDLIQQDRFRGGGGGWGATIIYITFLLLLLFFFKEKLADGRIFLLNSAFSYVRNIKIYIYNIFVNKANWKCLLFYIRIFY